MRIKKVGRILSAVILLGALQSCKGSNSTPEVLAPPPAPASTVATTALTLGDGSQMEVVEGEIILTYTKNISPSEIQAIADFLGHHNVVIIGEETDTQSIIIQVPSSALATILAQLKQLPGVYAAVPNIIEDQERELQYRTNLEIVCKSPPLFPPVILG